MPGRQAAPRTRFRIPWTPRTVLIQVPVHLVAFAVLYVAAYHLVMREVAATYQTDSQVLLSDAVNSIHPAMVCSDMADLQSRLDQFVASHRVLGLRLYDTDGTPISPSSASDPDVGAFLASDDPNRVRILESGRTATLAAMARIRAMPDCQPCHERDAVLGAAVITRDISDSLRATRSRVGYALSTLVGGWFVLVILVNLGTRGIAARSVKALQANVAGARAGARAGPSTAVGLDPLSHELYVTLENTLREHQEQRARLEGRFETAERLASLGQLAAGLAHEIKNPLAGIQGALELLDEECIDERRSDLYQRMLEELKRVNRTIHSLLHFARPSRPRRVALEVKEFLKDVAELAAPGLSRRGVSVGIDVAPSVRQFSLDPAQIRQVLVNLIANAADGIGNHGAIRILATPFPEGEGLILAVEDDGQGIGEDELAMIFEPFFTTKLHGTGLGLAVARRIVEEHGGTIRVSSRQGEGTTVFVLLPALPDDLDGPPSAVGSEG